MIQQFSTFPHRSKTAPKREKRNILSQNSKFLSKINFQINTYLPRIKIEKDKNMVLLKPGIEPESRTFTVGTFRKLRRFDGIIDIEIIHMETKRPF